MGYQHVVTMLVTLSTRRSLVIGLWPVLGIATLPVIVVETYGAVMALHFAPTFGFLRVKKVHSD